MTCFVRWRDIETEPAAPKGKPWPKSLAIFRSAFDEALGNSGKTTVSRAGMSEVKAVDREAVRDEFLRLYPADTPHAKKEAFRRCVQNAFARGVICSINVGPDLGQTILWVP
jgi:hypothetical protein